MHEAIYTLLMMKHDFICESANIEELDPAVEGANIVRERISNAGITTAMSNSFGFGRHQCEPGFPEGLIVEQKTPRDQIGPEARTGLMAGKRGLVMGVANDHSIAWGIARMLAAQGAEIAFTYQGEAQARRLKPLAASIASTIVLPADVEKDEELDAVFDVLGREWGGLDFLVHAIAFSDRDELKGRYVDTSRANFARSLDISCYSFTAVAKRAAALMGPSGGSLVTLSYLGASRVMPSYNVMGVAKAALEASVRYLAADLGRDGIRVNAISAGPMRTLAGGGGGRCPHRVQMEQEPFAAAQIGRTRPCRRRRALSAQRTVGRGHRRSAFRRCRLQHRRHAADRGLEKLGGQARRLIAAF